MYKSKSSRIIPIILIILVTIVLIGAITSAIRAIFGANTVAEPKVDVGKQALLSTADTARVRVTVRGPIVADENFRSYQISVSPSTRTMATYAGYLDRQIDARSYSNNTAAYEEFVYALDKANMLEGAELPAEKNDIRGICATGKIYEFEVLAGDVSQKRLWTSTCKGSVGSFRASVPQNLNLFIQQIPDYKPLVTKINL